MFRPDTRHIPPSRRDALKLAPTGLVFWKDCGGVEKKGRVFDYANRFWEELCRRDLQRLVLNLVNTTATTAKSRRRHNEKLLENRTTRRSAQERDILCCMNNKTKQQLRFSTLFVGDVCVFSCLVSVVGSVCLGFVLNYVCLGAV